MNHKYANRLTGKFIYFGEKAKEAFDKTKEAKKFVYIGEISKEEQEKEEQSSAQMKVEKLTDFEEKQKRNDDLTKNVPADAKELTQEELERITKEKQTIIDDETKGSSNDDETNDDETNDSSKPKKVKKSKTTENGQE